MAELVYVTVLPCGTSGGGLNFTAVLTPALETGTDLPAVFRTWPDRFQVLRGAWTLQIKRNGALVASGSASPVSAPADKDLWEAFIAGSQDVSDKIPVRKRRRANDLKGGWLLSHHAAHLHRRHDEHRGWHVAHQLLRNIRPGDRTTLDGILGQIEDTAPRNIYLFPIIQSGADAAMARLVADRNFALAFQQSRFAGGAPAMAAIRQRIDYGQDRLQSAGAAPLTGLALMALFRVCTESAAGLDSAAVQALLAAIDSAASNPQNISVYTAKLYDELQHYVKFHLFSKRAASDCATPPPLDFHQRLALLNQYPALLRPLGLAFDFRGVTLSGPVPAGAITASLQPPQLDGIDPKLLETACTDAAEFIAASRAMVHTKRFLNLRRADASGPLFSLIAEDTDGSSHKLTQQVAAASRGSEYRASVEPPTNGLGLPHPTNHVPSARTTGVALYHHDRDKLLAQAIANTPDANAVDITAPLFIEDLTLGYRVDVRNAGSTPGPWMSLHQRESTYTIHGHVFKPAGPALAADEGFITLAATQAPLDPAGGTGTNLQLQVHQSIMSWTGWSLSVPLPKSSGDDPMKKPKTPRCSGGPGETPVNAEFKLKSPGSLPKLRFDHTYDTRLRHVDLAGNSAPLEAAPASGAILSMTRPFSRHEPVRAPQILVEAPIDRDRRPGEHADRIVLRDGSPSASRVLAPPREPLRMAILHGFAEDGTLPSPAFPEYQLTAKGSFPSVYEAGDLGFIAQAFEKATAENQDSLLLARKGGFPEKAFYPDPMARFVRIEPLVLQQDLATYVPWRQDQDVHAATPAVDPAFYLDFQWIQPWPLASLVRVLVHGVGADQPLRIHQDWMPAFQPGTLPSIPVLHVDLPEGWIVALRLTSAACFEPGVPEAVSVFGARIRLNAPVSHNATPPGELPTGGTVSLFHSFVNVVPGAAPQGGVAPAAAAPAVAPPMAVAALEPQAAAALEFRKQVASALGSVPPETFACGTTHYVTPPRILTLVHALRQPLLPPDFELGDNCAGFQVVRAAGATTAKVTAKLLAHWLSTGKVTCNAVWSDTVDDPTKPDLVVRKNQETAFEYRNSGGPELQGKAKASVRDISTEHQFRDTRAHSVTYSLSAYTRFQEYYPEDPVRKDLFTRAAARTFGVIVKSSVRPPAPAIAYVMPAFNWQDAWEARTKTWRRGRTMVLRVYLQRPFLVSGDEECLGVVLASAGGAPRGPVTRWGSDPIVPSANLLATDLMTAADFAGGSLVPGGLLAEGGTADVLPFPVEFSKERSLWFCDIPLSPSRTPSAFAQLALVRWQPHALEGPDEARLSPVVVADFQQIGPDRCVAVSKVNAKAFSVTVSGVFRTITVNAAHKEPPGRHTISCSIEQRWHRLGRDMGWRPVCAGPVFEYHEPPTGSNVSAWTATVNLPHSSTFVQYRLLLEEREWLAADASKENTPAAAAAAPVAKPRVTYLHYIEL